MSNLDLVIWLLWWVCLLPPPFDFPLWTHPLKPSEAPLKPSSPHPPALWPSQVTLTWSSGYIGGCACCSTFHCGCSLCNPSYKDTPSVRLFSPSHFCFQFFIMDVPSPHTPPFMGLAWPLSVAQWGWMLCGSVRSFVPLSFSWTSEISLPTIQSLNGLSDATTTRHPFPFRKAQIASWLSWSWIHFGAQ